jgi:hypothetical protein
MSSIGGKQREVTGDFIKKVGLFEAEVIAINPTVEEFKNQLDIELAEDSKATEYLGERDGNITLRVDVWMRNVKMAFPDEERFKVSFFLENKERQNKDETKYQYINSVGMCSWADDVNNLAEWFSKDREVRVAYSGEEELYNFMRTWLSKLDYRHAETTLSIDWKKLMKGNVKDLRDQINGEWCGNIGALATVVTKERDGEIKEYQGIYNKAFLPPYSLKQFRLVDYSNVTIIENLSKKLSKKMKAHEKFVMNVVGEYGCKDFYTFTDLKEYNPEENMAASDAVISEEDASY